MTPMIGAVADAAASGLVCGLANVRGYVLGSSPSILSLITFVDTTPGATSPLHSVIFGIVAAVITMVISFGLTLIFFKPPVPEAEEAEEASAPEAPAVEAPKAMVDKIILTSPLTGQVVPLADVPDEVFSGGTLGEGVAVIPAVGKVIAPCDGTMSSTMDTMYAVGLTTDSGLELLVHVGLNTVELQGKCFSCKVEEDQAVRKGDVLIEFDIEGIKAAGYPLYTPVLVTNSDDYVSVKAVTDGEVQAGGDLLSIV